MRIICEHIETSSLWTEFVNKNRCISVRLVSEEVKSIKFWNFDNLHNSFLWPEYFIDFSFERWIPCQASTCVQLWNNFPCNITLVQSNFWKDGNTQFTVVLLRSFSVQYWVKISSFYNWLKYYALHRCQSIINVKLGTKVKGFDRTVNSACNTCWWIVSAYNTCWWIVSSIESHNRKIEILIK